MMGLGYLGCGGNSGNLSSSSLQNSSTSTSNLSASAPPFTVDRLNSKLNPKPILHYSDSRYNVEPFSDGWNYPHPWAPRSDLVMSSSSSGIASVPLSDNYQFCATASITPSSTHWSPHNPVTNASGKVFDYGGESKPCYSSYVPPFVGDYIVMREGEGSSYNDVQTSGQSLKAKLEYSTRSFSDMESGPQWVNGFGFDDAKRAKTLEFDRFFSSDRANVAGMPSYDNQRNDCAPFICKSIKDSWEGSAVPYNKCLHLEDSGTPYQKFNELFDREVHSASSIVGNIEDKSCLEGNLGCFPYYSNKMHIQDPISTFLKSEASKIETRMGDNSTKHVYSSHPYGNYIGQEDKPFTGPVSVMRSSPIVVIRPPPAIHSNSGGTAFSEKAACSDIDEGTRGLDSYQSTPLKRQDYGLKPSSKIREESFGGGIFNFSELGNYVFESTPFKEISGPLHASNTYIDPNIKSRFRPQLPDLNISSSPSVAGNNVQAVKISDDSLDLLNHQNLAVDSPCWKGAPSSKFSLVDFASSNFVLEALDDCHEHDDHEKHKSPCSTSDSRGVHFDEAHKITGNNKTEYLTAGAGLEALYLSREKNKLVGEVNVSSLTGPRSEGVEIGDLLTNLINNFEVKVSELKDITSEEIPVMNLNDLSEGGDVAIHAAEEVLASPVFRQDASECITLPDPKLNVATMVKALHNISELLLLHVSDDAFLLEEENTKALKHIIANISSFLSKTNMQASDKPEPSSSNRDSYLKLRECPDLNTISRSLSMQTKGINLHTELDIQPKLGEGKNCTFPGMKDEKSAIFSSSRYDDSEATREHDMGKAIKKVLEENFPFKEEMHSQAQLFKTLWLEAEAKLCSINYKAHFNRMQIQMEDMKLKAPQENEGNVKMNTKVSSSTIAPSELHSWKAHDGLDQKLNSRDFCIPCTTGHGDDIESSVVARYIILKSREDIPKRVNIEVEDKAEKFDGDHSDTVMARLNILKSREGSSESVIDKELQPKLVNGEFSGDKYLGLGGKLQGETFFLHQIADVNRGEYLPHADGAGYSSRDEFHLSVKEDPLIRSLKNAKMTDQSNCEWLDSSSSDWEHVRKDDFSWRNF